MRVLIVSIALLVAAAALAAAHPHQGVLARYAGTPPKLALSADDTAKLRGGDSILKQLEGEGGGRGMAVQDIAAPTDVVWGRILAFDDYPKMIKNVKEIEVYERTPDHVKVRFVIGEFGLKLEYFIDHVVKRDEGFMTWTLDYSRESELDDSVGYWFVEAHPTTPGWTRLYYSVDIKMRGWVPGFVESMVRDEGLVRATKWVKVESEKRARPAAP